MSENVETLNRIYERFNARDIAGVLAALSDDVVWANGMEGGHEHGLDAVRAYWMRQWALVRPQVDPLNFCARADGVIVVEVRQTLHDLDGKPLQGQALGLENKTVRHVFHLTDGKVTRFDIEAAA